MSKILVCGLVNVETTVRTESFPIEYCPIDYNFFGVNTYPAGVGLNLALSFNTLSDEVRLLSMVGDDSAGKIVESVLNDNNLKTDYLMKTDVTAQSVVIYDNSGKRRIFCDLKDFQEKSYDENIFINAASDCDVLCLCNINYSRNLLKIAREMDKCIACDVHVLADINDEYNRDFVQYADILFLSNENIVGREEEFLTQIKDNFNSKIIVCGLGSKGALMYVRDDDCFYVQNSFETRRVVNTVGAGDSLFSSFVHFYAKGYSPYDSIKYACVYASYKIGENGAAKGFLEEDKLLCLTENL